MEFVVEYVNVRGPDCGPEALDVLCELCVGQRVGNEHSDECIE